MQKGVTLAVESAMISDVGVTWCNTGCGVRGDIRLWCNVQKSVTLIVESATVSLSDSGVTCRRVYSNFDCGVSAMV